MLHIFADPADMQGELLTIRGSQVNHIRNVCRLQPGDEISVSNGIDTKEYRYGIEEIHEDSVVCRLRFVKEADVELPVKVYLFQGLPKADKMDMIVQKCTELGVYRVIPVAMARSVVKLDEERAEKKIRRWQTIAESAASQSRRRIIPQVTQVMSFTQAVQYAGDHCDLNLVPYELQKDDGSTKALFENIKPGTSVSIFIGPEGGFEPDEIALARENGMRPISLGRRILRTETAGMTVLAWLIFTLEIS